MSHFYLFCLAYHTLVHLTVSLCVHSLPLGDCHFAHSLIHHISHLVVVTCLMQCCAGFRPGVGKGKGKDAKVDASKASKPAPPLSKTAPPPDEASDASDGGTPTSISSQTAADAASSNAATEDVTSTHQGVTLLCHSTLSLYSVTLLCHSTLLNSVTMQTENAICNHTDHA